MKASHGSTKPGSVAFHRRSASLSYRYNNLMPHALAFYVGRNTPVYYVQSMWQKVA
jgi:hypothetical protein